MLPCNVLLDIFDFYRNDHDPDDNFKAVWEWHKLAHVCRTWRQIIFDSPLRLDLQIPCTYGTPVKKYLDIWPNLPISVDYCRPCYEFRTEDDENMIFALEHPDRVAHIGLAEVTDLRLRKLATVIQKPFPVLMCFIIFGARRLGEDPLLLPTKFLGGHASHLQIFHIANMAFPTLPTFLLSASDLVDLKLYEIPPTSYIPPEVMAACLAKLPRLKTLVMEFTFTPYPDQITPPITRTVLPALTHFGFQGGREYLEDLTARIICPRLDWVNVDYASQLAYLPSEIVQFSRFLNLSLSPGTFRNAQVRFYSDCVCFYLYRHMACAGWKWRQATTVISCRSIGWGASRVLQVLRTFSVILSPVTQFRLLANPVYSFSKADDPEWLQLLHQFSTVQALYTSEQFAVGIACALESISGEMAAEVLPFLDLICLEDQPTSSFEKFIAVRRLSGRPVAAVSTEEEFDQILDSYNKN
jgi:hypothetical protein